MRLARRIAPVVVSLALLLTIDATGVAAQDPPTVTTAALDGAIITSTGCDGDTTVRSNPGMLVVRRSGDTSGPLDVAVSYGGTLTPGDDYDALPNPVTIRAESDAQFFSIEARRPGTVSLTIEGGADYLPGTSSTATVEFVPIAFDTDCPEGESQTIGLGETPAPIDIYGRFGGALADTTVLIEGDLPPGLTMLSNGSWEGAATELGTFRFTAKYCLGDQCALELPITIVVGAASPPPAEPAVAVTAEVNFTG
jgi:hypothetical protein